jgi:hypothetical protein
MKSNPLIFSKRASEWDALSLPHRGFMASLQFRDITPNSLYRCECPSLGKRRSFALHVSELRSF